MILFKRLFKIFFFGSLIAGLLGSIAILLIINDLPKIKKLEDYKPPTPSKILTRDGKVLASLLKENREVIDIQDIPPVVIQAFLAAEDDTFYEHQGVDLLGILRALFMNIKAGKVVQGGSTITQQVAKSLLLSRERSFIRKLKDFLLAIKIEKNFSKEEILHLYLNQVYLGGGYYGVKTAFEGYFRKDLNNVSIAEAAMVAGLLVAPGRYSPYLQPQYAKQRQGYVLRRMLEIGRDLFRRI